MSPNTQPPVTSGPMHSPSGSAPSLRPNEVAPNPHAMELRAVPWSRVEGADRELTVHYVTSGRAECNVLGRTDAVETDKTVTVTLFVGHLPETRCDGPQPLTATANTTKVTLARPLGTRTVVDGSAHD